MPPLSYHNFVAKWAGCDPLWKYTYIPASAPSTQPLPSNFSAVFDNKGLESYHVTHAESLFTLRGPDMSKQACLPSEFLAMQSRVVLFHRVGHKNVPFHWFQTLP